MTEKEKLINLIARFAVDHDLVLPCASIADHLLTNGVTIQKWIPVTERLPEEEGLYLVAVVNDHERRYSKTAWYHGHRNWFLHQKVTHWMPMPEPPKEEP